MCRIHEGQVVSHVGVEFRPGLYADRLDDGSVTLCQHLLGDLSRPKWEVTLTASEIKNLSGRLPKPDSVAAVVVPVPVPVPEVPATETTVSKKVTPPKPPIVAPSPKPRSKPRSKSKTSSKHKPRSRGKSR